MEDDVENRVFMLKIREDDCDDNNMEALQALFDEGWTADYVSERMTTKNGFLVKFMILERSKFNGKD